MSSNRPQSPTDTNGNANATQLSDDTQMAKATESEHVDSQPINFKSSRSSKSKGKQRQFDSIDSYHSIQINQINQASTSTSASQQLNSFTPPNPSSPIATFGSFTSTPPTGRLSLDSTTHPQQSHRRNQFSQSSSFFESTSASAFEAQDFSSPSPPNLCGYGRSNDESQAESYDFFGASLATTAATSYSPSPPRILNFSNGKGKEKEKDGGLIGKRMEELMVGEEEGHGIREVSEGEGMGADEERILQDDQFNQIGISLNSESRSPNEAVEVIGELCPPQVSSNRPSISLQPSPSDQIHPIREASLPPSYLQETNSQHQPSSSTAEERIPLNYAEALGNASVWRRTRSNRNSHFLGSTGELPPYATDDGRLPDYQVPTSSTNVNSEGGRISPTTERRRLFGGGNGGNISRFNPSGFLRRMRTNSLTPEVGSSTNMVDSTNSGSIPTSVVAGLPSSSTTSAIPSAFLERPTISSVTQSDNVSSPPITGRRPFERSGSAPSHLATNTPPISNSRRVSMSSGPEDRSGSLLRFGENRPSMFSEFRERVRSRRSSLATSQSPIESRPVSLRSASGPGQNVSRPGSSAGFSVNGSLMSNNSRPGPGLSTFRFPNSTSTQLSSGNNSRPTSSSGIRPSGFKKHGKTFSLKSFSDVFGNRGGEGDRSRRVSTSSVPEARRASGSGSTSLVGESSVANQENVGSSSNVQSRGERLSTVFPSPDALRPQASIGDLAGSEFQLNPSQNGTLSGSNPQTINRVASRRSPIISTTEGTGIRPSLLRQGYSAPLATTSFTIGSAIPSLEAYSSTTPKADLFDLILPRELRIRVFSDLVKVHEGDFQRLVERDEWRGRLARESGWIGREKGIRELVRISRVSKTWQNMVLDGQLWQLLEIAEFPNISERALISIARSAGPFVKHLDLTGLSNLPSSALIALTQAHAGEISLSDPINHQPIQGIGSTSLVFPTPSRSASVGGLDLGPTNSSNLLASNQLVTRLTTLKLKGCSSISTNALHHLLTRSPDLKLLSLSDLSCVKDSTLQILSEFNVKLEELDISRCQKITGEGVTILANSLEELRILRAVGLKGVNESMMLSISEGMEQLESLNLSYSDVNDSSIASFVSTTETEESDFVVELTPRDAGGDLSGNSMHFRKILNLRHLALSSCRGLTDRSLIHLAYAVPKIEILELANNGINFTDRGLTKLFGTIPLIRKLDLEGATEITESTIEALTPPASYSEMLSLYRISSGSRSRRSILRSSSTTRPPVASTSASTSPPPAPPIPGSQLTHLALSHASRIEPSSISLLIQRAPFLKHLHLDDTRIGDSTIKEFVKLSKEREFRNAFISTVDCRNITRGTCNELSSSGSVRPRFGRRGYEFIENLYDDPEIEEGASSNGRASGLDECNPDKVVLQSFWGWQNVDHRIKGLKKKEDKKRKTERKARGRLNRSNGDGNLGGNNSDDENDSRWNRLTNAFLAEEDEDTRNCRVM